MRQVQQRFISDLQRMAPVQCAGRIKFCKMSTWSPKNWSWHVRYTHVRVEPHSKKTWLGQCARVSYGHDQFSSIQLTFPLFPVRIGREIIQPSAFGSLSHESVSARKGLRRILSFLFLSLYISIYITSKYSLSQDQSHLQIRCIISIH